MEIIACIPELPCPPITGAADPSVRGVVEALPRPGSGGPSNAAPMAAPEDLEPTERSASPPRAADRRRAVLFPKLSVLGLAVIAAVVWAAAWRNERLRAIEQRRPQRVAMEPASAAAAARSVMP